MSITTKTASQVAPGHGVKERRNGLTRRFFRTPSGLVGLSIITVLIFLAVFAPLLTPYNSTEIVSTPFGKPFSEFVLGTDALGRDVFTQIVYGARVSILVGIFGAGLAAVVGIILGALAGFFRGATDVVIMRVSELFQILPALIIALVAASLFGGSLLLVVVIIALTFWPDTSRIVRAGFLTLRERDFVKAAKVTGFSNRYLIFSEIAPNALPPVIAQTALNIGWAILVEAGLSFIGVGDANQASWGKMLGEAQSSLGSAPWLSFFPGLAIMLTVLGFNLIGDGLTLALNPKLSHAKRKSRNTQLAVVRPDAPAAPVDTTAVSILDRGFVPPANGSGDPLLDVKDLVFHLRVGDSAVKAVDGVSLTVMPDECVGIVGESGSGKSTIARIVSGLLPPVNVEKLEGEVILNGHEVLGASPSQAEKILRRRGISMVFQDPMGYLNPTMRVEQQIAEGLPAGLTEKQKSNRVDQLLQKVELDPASGIRKRYPHQISGGQRQRVLIALALALEPRLLIADEPTTALDATVQAQIVETLLKIHREENLAILLITHDLGLVTRMCDRVYVMRRGRFVESGTTDLVYNDPEHPYTKMLMDSRPGHRAKNASRNEGS